VESSVLSAFFSLVFLTTLFVDFKSRKKTFSKILSWMAFCGSILTTKLCINLYFVPRIVDKSQTADLNYGIGISFPV